MFVIGQEVAACGAALAGGNQVLVAAVGVHDENLVAIVGRPRGLKNQPLAVGRPVGLRILASVSQLPDVAEVIGLGRREASGRDAGKNRRFHT